MRPNEFFQQSPLWSTHIFPLRLLGLDIIGQKIINSYDTIIWTFLPTLVYTHTHTLIYIYIYIYTVTPPKNRTQIFLTDIHKSNCSLFFFSGYEVDSVREKLGPTCPEVRVYKIRIILLYFCRSIKKNLWVLFFLGGGDHPIYIYIYIYIYICNKSNDVI